LGSDPPWHTSSPIWRKSGFTALGGFNEAVMYGDDSDLHIKTLLRAVPHQKYPDCLPDAFIRRGRQQRITTALFETLAGSRRVRLTEGKQLLVQMCATPHAHDLWEGQFFIECEELLFNASEPHQHIANVMRDWASLCHPPRIRQWLVRSYFRVGSLLRDRVYLAVRIARRLARMALPSSYFPSGGEFQSWVLSEQAMEQVRFKLARNEFAPVPAERRHHVALPARDIEGR
jgi:hypothetical protein